MAKSISYINNVLHEREKVETIEALSKNLNPLTKDEIAALDHNGYNTGSDAEATKERQTFLQEKDKSTAAINGFTTDIDGDKLKGNIENFIGMAQIPIGLAGPLYINGKDARGDFYIPLATTEGALVASYNRGMKACRLSGGITSVCLVEGVQRSPFFKFRNIGEVGLFIKWIHDNTENIKKVVSETSRFARLNEVNSNIEGNSVIVTFEFYTGDAAGQNMVTICTDRICRYIFKNFDIRPVEWYIESNYSGDKKATALSFSNVRGKKVAAEITIPRNIVADVLKTTPEQIEKYWISSTLAVTQSGSIGAQGHVANGLTALFIACGQDVACISESSVGVTRMQVTEDGDLYVALTLPSLIVGTVGGGTNLPTQKECLEMIDCHGVGKARKFAEVCCAVALAGELSIAAAMSVDHFTTAHEKLGRK
ncbi:MAG: hydroxymethylglutaryl-CoA reductase [bacterium]|nr:hydroxymethylglutaryl-CoA reductase [bacterium]